LIRTIESVKIDDSGIIQPSNLITQQQDPIVAIEKELKVRLDQETKDKLREIAIDEATYQGKVAKMLDHLREKYKGNYKVLKHIDHLEPLYDIHEFWDSQPVPKAYETVDDTMYDQQIDKPKTVAEVKPEPFNLPTGYVWANVDIRDRA
jgi:hypothetical protein